MSSKRSRVHPRYKTKYKVTNWPEYDRSLVQRGDVTLWASPDAIANWDAKPTGRRDGQHKYSDLAIETALTLRFVFHLPLRQVEGFLGSLFKIMDVDLNVPDHTTISRRGQRLDVRLQPLPSSEPIDLIVDSSGLANVEQDIDVVVADAACDTRPFYTAATGRGASVVVPPTKNATGKGRTGADRDDTIRRVNEIGRRRWKKESGYHRQARVENSFFRYKSIVGGRLRARGPEAQVVEAQLACNIRNRMTELGRPESVAIRT